VAPASPLYNQVWTSVDETLTERCCPVSLKSTFSGINTGTFPILDSPQKTPRGALEAVRLGNVAVLSGVPREKLIREMSHHLCHAQLKMSDAEMDEAGSTK